MRRELGIAKCGLACCLCSDTNCPGCNADGCKEKDWCENRNCTLQKGLAGCYLCEEPCQKGLLSKLKPHTFILFIKKYGLDMLLDCLERNEKNGILYHRKGFHGDYDDFDSEDALLQFILTGKK